MGQTKSQSTQRNARQSAFLALRAIHQGAYADVALDRQLGHAPQLENAFVTELVYGIVRRQSTLDALINQFAKKKADQQHPDLRRLLHIGLYQLRYLTQIPVSAAVNSTVELAKLNGLVGLAPVVNGLLREYQRQAAIADPLELPADPVARLAIAHSYPEWIVRVWLDQFGWSETEALCTWMNRPATIDLRVNTLRSQPDQVIAALQDVGIETETVNAIPNALRIVGNAGAIWKLPGFEEGWWTVQDSSSQLVTHFLNPQPGALVIDACAAPGGKTTHIAEMMGDRGTVWACDRAASRLKKVEQNAQRLGLDSIRVCVGDSRVYTHFNQSADYVLVDAPCSGLGTLHRHADARWRQTPDKIQELSALQQELLAQASRWLKPDGIMVYSTCTLHPDENEQVVQRFLDTHSTWQIDPPLPSEPAAAFAAPQGWVKVLPHQQNMDGFFMVRLRQTILQS